MLKSMATNHDCHRFARPLMTAYDRRWRKVFWLGFSLGAVCCLTLAVIVGRLAWWLSVQSSATADHMTTEQVQTVIVASAGKVDLSNRDMRGDDLSGFDLSGANLAGTNLAGANLGCTKLIGANLTGANMTKVTMVCNRRVQNGQ